MKKIFVYGTLLNGFSNWKHYLDNNNTFFMGEDTLPSKYTMVSLGGFPGVIPKGETSIKGEVYEVSKDVYKAVEYLEGYHPDPKITLYSKEKVDTKFGEADMYILNKNYLFYPKVETGNWKDEVRKTI